MEKTIEGWSITGSISTGGGTDCINAGDGGTAIIYPYGWKDDPYTQAPIDTII